MTYGHPKIPHISMSAIITAPVIKALRPISSLRLTAQSASPSHIIATPNKNNPPSITKSKKRFISEFPKSARLLAVTHYIPTSSRHLPRGGSRGTVFVCVSGGVSWIPTYRLELLAHGKSTDRKVGHRQKCRSIISGSSPRGYGLSRQRMSFQEYQGAIRARLNAGCQASLIRLPALLQPCSMKYSRLGAGNSSRGGWRRCQLQLVRAGVATGPRETFSTNHQKKAASL